MLTRYDPFARFTEMQRELNRLFDTSGQRGDGDVTAAADWAPTVDIRESPDAYTLLADIPGVEPKDVEITMEHGVLTLKGSRESFKEEERNNIRRTERIAGTFLRRFTMPETVDPDGISAKHKNGVLEVRIPKSEKAQPRRITVEG